MRRETREDGVRWNKKEKKTYAQTHVHTDVSGKVGLYGPVVNAYLRISLYNSRNSRAYFRTRIYYRIEKAERGREQENFK